MTRRELFGGFAAALSLPFLAKSKPKPLFVPSREQIEFLCDTSRSITYTLPAARRGDIYTVCVDGKWHVLSAPSTTFTIS